MRDVEALDAARQLGQHERVGQRLLDGLARGLQHAEPLRVGLLRVLPGKIDQRPLFAALRNGQLDAVAGALAQQRGQRLAIVEVDRDQNRARHILLVDVKLLEQSREDWSGVEWDFTFCPFS